MTVVAREINVDYVSLRMSVKTCRGNLVVQSNLHGCWSDKGPLVDRSSGTMAMSRWLNGFGRQAVVVFASRAIGSPTDHNRTPDEPSA